jgi:hypothetical protein
MPQLCRHVAFDPEQTSADGADVQTQRGVGAKLSVVSLWDIPLKNVGRGGLTLDYGEHACSVVSGTMPRSWGQ